MMGISSPWIIFGLVVRHLISVRFHLQTRNYLSEEKRFIENFMTFQESLWDYTLVPLSGISTDSIQNPVL